jgi:hypothetical protein
MAHMKLNEADDDFLSVPQAAVMIASGVSGTETFIERDKDTTVRIVLQTVAFAASDSAKLKSCIEIGDAQAFGEDGPAPAEHHLQSVQSVQVVVKAGERLGFKAYPIASGATVLKTVVYTADLR